MAGPGHPFSLLSDGVVVVEDVGSQVREVGDAQGISATSCCGLRLLGGVYSRGIAADQRFSRSLEAHLGNSSVRGGKDCKLVSWGQGFRVRATTGSPIARARTSTWMISEYVSEFFTYSAVCTIQLRAHTFYGLLVSMLKANLKRPVAPMDLNGNRVAWLRLCGSNPVLPSFSSILWHFNIKDINDQC